ncbi:MAG: hypothetical protein GF313_08650 [Caldithrix sp.]|nr:hypothetical protein [Caldithrix sp.]
MNPIEDIKQELTALPVSVKNIRYFALPVGFILLLLGVWLQFNTATLSAIFLLVIGLGLAFSGLMIPKRIVWLYKIWMTLALSLGWLISRLLMVLVFYAVLTPIGFILKLFGKRLMDHRFTDKADSYWHDVRHQKSDYEKMY